MRLGYKSEFLPLLHKVAIWFPVVTFLCNRCEARPRIQRVGLAEQQEWSRVQFHFHTASKATKIHPCSHMTIDCKLILQFKSNDFQFTVCIIDPKENRAEVSPPKVQLFTNYHIYPLVIGKVFEWANTLEYSKWCGKLKQMKHKRPALCRVNFVTA